MSQEPPTIVKGDASYVEPNSKFPSISSISSFFSGNKSPTSLPPVTTNEQPPEPNGLTVQGDVSVLPFYQRISQNIKSYKFLQTKLIIDTVKQLKELRLPLTEPYGIDIPSNLINPISQNETNINNVISTIKSKTDKRLKDINTALGKYGFNFVTSMSTIDDKLKTEIANEIEVVNKTLDLKFKNVFVKNVNEIRTEISKSYNDYFNNTLYLDKVNTPQYYESVIKIAKTFIENKLKENKYLNANNITDEQLDVLLKLNGVQFGAYFLKPAEIAIAIPENTIYIGKGTIKSRKSGTLFSYSKTTKDCFLNSDGTITDSSNQYTWAINYSQSNKLNFIGHKGGNFTRRMIKNNKITKNKRSNRRKTHKLSN
jgi:virulence-associated protein VapD